MEPAPAGYPDPDSQNAQEIEIRGLVVSHPVRFPDVPGHHHRITGLFQPLNEDHEQVPAIYSAIRVKNR
jgi:hypothetical protein